MLSTTSVEDQIAAALTWVQQHQQHAGRGMILELVKQIRNVQHQLQSLQTAQNDGPDSGAAGAVDEVVPCQSGLQQQALPAAPPRGLHFVSAEKTRFRWFTVLLR